MQTREGSLSGGSGKPTVAMAAHLTKSKVFINVNGDEIDPVTKRVIKRNTEDKK